MKKTLIFAAALCVAMLLSLSVALGENAVLTVQSGTFSAPPDATEIDLGEVSIRDTDEEYAALEAFLAKLPGLTRMDMFATDIPQNRLEALAEKFPNIEFGWTMYIPCRNELRPDRGPHRIRTDQTAFSTLHNISCNSHDETVWRILKYCKNLMALDVGHNNTLSDLSFLYDLPKLKVLILSFNLHLDDITPIGSLKDLEYLEICKNEIHDLSPLANCTQLVDLNICTNRVQDLSPLYGLKNLRRLYLMSCQDHSGNPIPRSLWQEVKNALPDCDVNNTAINLGGTWRLHPRYDTLKEMFGFGNTSATAIEQHYVPFSTLD